MYDRVLVTGAAGMVGSDLVPYLSDVVHVIATDIVGDLERLDVSDPQETWRVIERHRPQLIIHLAAETDLERCETNPVAIATNIFGTLNVALAAQKIGARLVYISTAGVFSGSQHSYTVFDHPNPINVYGESKLRGEFAVLAVCERPLILRPGWMFGGGPGKDHKFVGMILDQIAAGETHLKAVDDKYGSPTYTEDLSSRLWGLVELDGAGIFHAAGDGGPSRYEVALEIVSILGRKDIEVEAVSSAVFSNRYPVRRPTFEVLQSQSMRPWHIALEAYLKRHWAHLIQPIAA